jgi:hypothetical protein
MTCGTREIKKSNIDFEDEDLFDKDVGDNHRGPLNNRENPLSFAKNKTQMNLQL